MIATEAGRYAEGLRATVQVWNGHMQAVQQLALAKPETWAEFVSQVAAQLSLDATEPISQAVMSLAAGVEGVLRQAEQASEVRASAQATELVELAGSVELFHDAAGDAYVSVDVDGHQERWSIKGKGFRRWLAQQFYQAHDKAPGSQAVQDALGVLEGKVLFKGEEIAVYTRLAGHDGKIYLDLATEHWQAIEITSTGWHVVDTPPVKFRRPRGMLPLPHPVTGGNIQDFLSPS